MYELVPIVSAAEHEDWRTVGHEIEQQRHHAEPTESEHRAGPNDGDVEPGRDRVMTREFRPQLGPAVRLERSERRAIGDRVAGGYSVHCA